MINPLDGIPTDGELLDLALAEETVELVTNAAGFMYAVSVFVDKYEAAENLPEGVLDFLRLVDEKADSIEYQVRGLGTAIGGSR
ncbi:hypothetical protein [Rhodococcus erythropolis]|uniref:hypothetical protein n=1 Tax=Rhodococcus erythropolis TaxID=1833 RepID=UPI001BE4F8C7|nr:hypothetical protein [Rhodococcus erythropolis]MBT2266431.1 hypothetical protein [Rhodococcus erythropolis]